MNKRRRYKAKRYRRLNRIARISHDFTTWEWRTIQRFVVALPDSDAERGPCHEGDDD
jgi:hypothetical protein